jgi:hypothetical protein
MPAYPDRDTLRLRRPDRRTPAEAVALVRRELARRPPATPADVHLAVEDRALAMLTANYPGVAERFHGGVLWSYAHGYGRAGGRSCAWAQARAWSRRYGKPPPRVDQLGRLLLGDPCGSCQVALGWRPPAPPRPKPKPARSSKRPVARSQASTRTRAHSRTVRWPAPAALVGATRAALTTAQKDYNLTRARALRLPPGSYEHLTGGRT